MRELEDEVRKNTAPIPEEKIYTIIVQNGGDKGNIYWFIGETILQAMVIKHK